MKKQDLLKVCKDKGTHLLNAIYMYNVMLGKIILPDFNFPRGNVLYLLDSLDMSTHKQQALYLRLSRARCCCREWRRPGWGRSRRSTPAGWSSIPAPGGCAESNYLRLRKGRKRASHQWTSLMTRNYSFSFLHRLFETFQALFPLFSKREQSIVQKQPKF